MVAEKNNPASVTVKRRFAAAAETVFDAFLDPGTAGGFMFATPKSGMVKVEIDARVGGRFNFTDRRDGKDVAHTGEYLEIDRPEKLVFTLQVKKYSQEIDKVTIEIRSSQQGCELKLTHEMGPNLAGIKGQVEEGWGSILERVAAMLGEPYIKDLYVEKSVDIDARPETVWRVLTDSTLSRQWIATWWPGTTLASGWRLGDPVVWTMDDGTVGAGGEVTSLNKQLSPMMILEFTFRVVHEGAEKQEKIKYFITEEKNHTKLSIFVGNFGDTPEHELCYPGAEQAWSLSLPKIKEIAESLV